MIRPCKCPFTSFEMNCTYDVTAFLVCIVNVNDLSSKYNFVYIIENNIVIFDRERSVLFFMKMMKSVS